MTYAYDTHTGDGTTVSWSFSFLYLDPSHVVVDVNGVRQTGTVVGSNTVQLASGSPAPAGGTTINVYRVTPLTPLASWLPATLNDSETNRVSQLQVLYATQEAADTISRLSDTSDLPQIIAQALAFGGVWTIQGPPGPTGSVGTTGGAGATGPGGPQGIQGPTGLTGGPGVVAVNNIGGLDAVGLLSLSGTTISMNKIKVVNNVVAFGGDSPPPSSLSLGEDGSGSLEIILTVYTVT